MFRFVRESLINYHDTGAIAPSSRYLARKIIASAGVKEGASVLELGPGTGAFTGPVLKEIENEGRYLGIEINPRFHKELTTRFPDIDVELASAADLDLKPWTDEHGQFDCIVSGLPWVSFKPELQSAIIDNIFPHLRPGGIFATFAYTGPHLRPPSRRFRQMLRDRFSTVTRTGTVFRNLPPALVVVATK